MGEDASVSDLQIPEGLHWWQGEPGGPEWLERLPSLVAACVAEWDLVLDDPFPDGHIALVVPGRRRAGGDPVVLKVNVPDAESEHEGAALRTWDGDGAMRLLAEAPRNRALLVERLSPGRQLRDVADPERADEIVALVLRRLWRPLGPDAPFATLAAVARRWRDALPARWERHGRLYERDLLDEATGWIDRLVPSMPATVLVHQDLHGGNILWDDRRGWLAIDPKPLAGEPAFDTASRLRDGRPELAEDRAAERTIRQRLDRLADLLDLDRERMRGWGIVHALAWLNPGEGRTSMHVRVARWLAEA